MGKGDKKTTKGKRVMGSYGNTRKRAKKAIKKSVAPVETEVKKVKKATVKKEVVAKETTKKAPAEKKAPVKKVAAPKKETATKKVTEKKTTKKEA